MKWVIYMKSFIKWIIVGIILVSTTGCDTDAIIGDQSMGEVYAYAEPEIASKYNITDTNYGLEELYEKGEFSTFMELVPEPNRYENVEVYQKKVSPSKDILKFTKVIFDKFPELLEDDLKIEIATAPIIFNDNGSSRIYRGFDSDMSDSTFEFLNITNGDDDDMYIFICHYLGEDKNKLIDFYSQVRSCASFFELNDYAKEKALEQKLDYEYSAINGCAHQFGVIIYSKGDKAFERKEFETRLNEVLHSLEDVYMEYTY